MEEKMLANAALSRPAAPSFRPAQTPALPGGEMAMLDSVGTRVTVARDATLFYEGDLAEHWYKVVSGAIRICKVLPDGRRQLADFFLPGDLVGFDLGESHAFAAEAVTDSVVIKFPRRRVETLVNENPRLGRALLSLAIERLAAAQSQMVLLGRKNATERLASFLLGLIERTGQGDAAEPAIALTMTRADIADYLGLTIETVSRTFARLKQLNAISLPHPQRVIVRDRERLEDLAEAAE
jgi:CRP/FNR family transcriptional regulator